jgi:chloramphenicol O-acetyltransferase type A
MREIEFNLDENPFVDMLSSRYSISARVNVEKLWKYCKENDKSFFIMSLGCLMNASNNIDAFKRRIIDGKAVEFDHMDGTSPIMDENNDVYLEMRVEPPQNFSDIFEWHDYVKDLTQSILSGEVEGFSLDMHLRDSENIINFSCIPWVDFDSITTCIVESTQIQPLITWGRMNENYEMTVAITVSHIFVNGRELGYFYENVQNEFNQF